MSEENKAVMRRFYEEFVNAGNLAVAPTGKRAEFQGIATVRIRGGKIAENRGMPDMLGLLQQLGAVPAAP